MPKNLYMNGAKVQTPYYNGAKVKKVYFNNVLVYSGGFEFTYTGAYTTEGDLGGNFVIRFLTSGTLTVTDKGDISSVDWFAVGGGGCGGQLEEDFGGGGMGGGGGYTSTIRGAAVPTSIQIVIGAGSSEYTTYETLVSAGASYVPNVINANGGRSAFFASAWRSDYETVESLQYGASGGSGGGCGGNPYDTTRGGSDGSDGVESSPNRLGGIGQGTTTREFGESTGKLYSGGGGGGGKATSDSTPMPGGDGGGGAGALAPSDYSSTSIAPSPGAANTGGGGGGGAKERAYVNVMHGASGGSGIVCVRNHR